MSFSETLSAELTEPQHRSRERSLTPHHASRAHNDQESVVLAGSGMILVSDARGDVREHADSRGLGRFYHDTRFLSVYELSSMPDWSAGRTSVIRSAIRWRAVRRPGLRQPCRTHF